LRGSASPAYTGSMAELQFFDPEAEYWVAWRRLPHWTQPGTICFVTWRTVDSMPKPVVARWIAERNLLFQKYGIAPNENWKVAIDRLAPADGIRIHRKLTERWDEFLDECHGACVLKRAHLSEIVTDSLQHFDGDRYTLTDFVVMPNHVHLLAAFPDEMAMLKQCHSWKRYTAVRINQALKISGEFWQSDGFDHLVRSEEQFVHYRRYITDNPRRAGLRDGEYRHYSKPVSAGRV